MALTFVGDPFSRTGRAGNAATPTNAAEQGNRLTLPDLDRDIMNPEPRAQSPEPRAQSPEPRAQSPEPRAQSPEPRAQSPEPRAHSCVRSGLDSFSGGSSPPSPASSRFPSFRLARNGLRGALCALACALPLLFAAGAAQAQTSEKLVGNTGQTTGTPGGFHASFDYAQGFTTGSNSEGYTLKSVGFNINLTSSGNTTEPTYTLSIWSSDSDGDPDSSSGTLTNPAALSAGVNSFTSSDGIDLEASTTYFVVLQVTSLGDRGPGVRTTTSDNEDSGAAAGWSVANRGKTKSSSGSTWSEFTQDSNLMIEVHGYANTANTAPTVANAIPDQSATSGTAFSYQFPANTFNDADTGDTLTYTATKSDDTALPSWLSFDAATRTFSGTPQSANVGTLSVKVTASDGTASVSDTFDIVVAAVPPATTGVDISSTPSHDVDNDGTQETYGLDETIQVQVTFDKAVTVDTTGGTPRLKIKMHSTYGEKWANYQSGSGTTVLTFAYTVVAQNISPNGIAVLEDTLELNGGTIKDAANSSDANLAHEPKGHDSEHKVDYRLTTTNNAPTVANAIPDRTATAGTAFSYQFPANTFNDADGDTLTYTATRSDDSALPTWLTFTASSRTFSGTPQTANIGTLSVKVTASDGTASVSDAFDIVVSSEPQVNQRPSFVSGFGPLRLEPDEAMTPATLPAATGGDGAAYSYTLTSSPAGLAGLSFDAGTRILSGTPGAEGRWTFTYTAHDGDADTTAADAARLTFQVTVGMAVEEQQQVVKRTLAAVATRTAASALNTIGTRLGDGVPGAGLTIAGRTVRPDGVAFSHPLGAAEGDLGFDPKAVRWSVWGRGDLGSFAGRPGPGMRYRGKVRTGWFGVDARGTIGASGGSRRWVAGLAVSHGTGKSDYSLEGGGDPADRSRLETELNALWPYGRWTFGNGLELRGMLGAGTGRLRHMPGDGGTAEESELTMRAVSVGLRRTLAPLAGIDLAAQGDASFVRMRTEKGGQQTIDGLRVDTWRVRAGLEASRRFGIADDRSLTPFLELAARRDGGDGLTGTGLELAGGLRHAAPGIDIELRGRWLAAHTGEDIEEHGVSLTVRMLPQDRGRGLSMSLSTRGGADAGGADALWGEGMPKGAPGTGGEAVELRAGYGIAAFADRFTATPNAGISLSDGGARDYRIGWRLTSAMRDDPGFEVNLDATRREGPKGGGPPKHGIGLTSMIRW